MSKQEWATFEFMDRAATVELMIAELLTDHPVGKHPALAAKLTALEEAAGQLYQAAGSHHHGYHITTPAESPAKPEPVICSACRTFGCDDHVPDAGKMVNPPAVVKPDPTPDVPVVDAVWVEDKNGRLCGYGHWNAMHAIWGYDVRSGTARIVRLAPDPDLAATVKRLEERLSKLEATVSDLQSDAAKHDNELELLRLKAATTTAKVRVVLPEIPGWATDDRVTAGWNSCIVQVKLALSAAGIDVVKEASK